MTATEIRSAIDQWFRGNIACGAIARNTEAYNQAHAAVAALKDQLAPLGQPKPAQPAPAAEE